MWTEHVLNPKIIPSIFKNENPSLIQVKMQEITVIFGESLLCRVYFDLKDFPIDAPLKWIQNKYNTVQFSINLISTKISHFYTQGDMIGDLLIDYSDSYFNIEFITSEKDLAFKATSKWVSIDKISGYIDNKI